MTGMDLHGSVALVTGANRGLGLAIVEALLQAGVAKVYAAARQPSAIAIPDPRIVPLLLDVADPAQIAAAAGRAVDVQVLVNNAGVTAVQPLLDGSDPRGAELEMRVNYFGTLDMCRAFAPLLVSNGGGAIVNVLSILGRVPSPRLGGYSASKAAAVSLTQSIRAQLAASGTLVIGVLPGFIDTDMARRVTAPKLSPQAVANTIVEALLDGVEDVYPGTAADIEQALRKDPKAVERQFAVAV
jgi:NAD(P)-dependent dehydrogenase (short-subunit alcohol dehydrogenase family)